jgi:hypothetical protein
MKLEYHGRWLRMGIELFPKLIEIRRYRVVPVPLDEPTGRLLRRRIAGELRRPSSSSGGTSSASPQPPLLPKGRAL